MKSNAASSWPAGGAAWALALVAVSRTPATAPTPTRRASALVTAVPFMALHAHTGPAREAQPFEPSVTGP